MPNLDRRQFAILAAAAAAARPAWAEAAQPPVIVAEGGAAEERIEDTRSALDLAINQGCDFIQVNLVPTKEGVLVARRSDELSASTDVASHPEFADRKTTRTIAGHDVAGWFADDFTLAELETLFCREAQPALRPQNSRYDGKEPILSLPQVLALARDGCVRTGRTIGACLRLVRPLEFQAEGQDVVQRLASELGVEGYIAPAAAVWVQAFEPEALQVFSRLSPVRRMLMIAAEGGAPDAAALTAVSAYARAIGPDQGLLLDFGAEAAPTALPLAGAAHAAGLQVFSHTVRAENAFLPPILRRGTAPGQRGDDQKLIAALFALPIDGLATDIPSDASRVRRSIRAH